MPLYEYACRDCQVAFETLQKMAEAPLKTCPFCEQDVLIKLFSCPNIFIEKEPTTLGEQAALNTKRMSKDELAEKSELKKLKKRQGLEEMSQKVGGKLIKKSEKLPWWRDGKTFGSIKSEKPVDTTKFSNIRKYIETGQT